MVLFFGFRIHLDFVQQVVQRILEIIDSRTRDNDAIALASAFFGDPQELAPIVLAIFQIETLPLRREFAGNDNVFCTLVHTIIEKVAVIRKKREMEKEIFAVFFLGEKRWLDAVKKSLFFMGLYKKFFTGAARFCDSAGENRVWIYTAY